MGLLRKIIGSKNYTKFRQSKVYVTLWMNDRLGDQIGQEPAKLDKLFNKSYRLIKAFTGIWAVVGGGWLALKPDDIKKSTTTFVDLIFSSKVHYQNVYWDVGTTIFDALSIIWGFLFFFTMVIEDRHLKESLKKLRTAIIQAPSITTFQTSRTYIDQAFVLSKEVKKHLNEYQTENFVAPNALDVLIIFLTSANALMIKSARNFFDSQDISGGNLMIYFEYSNANRILLTEKILKKTELYFRPERQSDLKGYLYLVPALVYDLVEKDNIKRITPPIILPVYDPDENVYNASFDSTENTVVPGALLAYTDDTSMVANTKLIKKYYGYFEERLQNEIQNFFQGEGKGIRSFGSFKIPMLSNPNIGVGVLNLDSDVAYAFGEDEELLNTFYTMIYPILGLISEYLEYYKLYLIDSLTNPEKYTKK